MMPCTTDRPSPLPVPTGLVVKNGSKTLRRVAASMPCRVSLTTMRAWSPGRRLGSTPAERSSIERFPRLLGHLSGRDVLERPLHSGNHAGFVAHGLADRAHVEPASFGGEDIEFEIKRRAVARASCERGGNDFKRGRRIHRQRVGQRRNGSGWSRLSTLRRSHGPLRSHSVMPKVRGGSRTGTAWPAVANHALSPAMIDTRSSACSSSTARISLSMRWVVGYWSPR